MNDKEKRCFSLVSGIDAKYVESAASRLKKGAASAERAEEKPSKTGVWFKRVITAAAACFLIAFVTVMAIILLNGKRDPAVSRENARKGVKYESYKETLWLNEKDGTFYMEERGRTGTFCGVGEAFTSYYGKYKAIGDERIVVGVDEAYFEIDLTGIDKKVYDELMDKLDNEYALTHMTDFWDLHTTPDDEYMHSSSVQETLTEMVESLKKTGKWKTEEENGYETTIKLIDGNKFAETTEMGFKEDKHATLDETLKIIEENKEFGYNKICHALENAFGQAAVTYELYESKGNYEIYREFWFDKDAKEMALAIGHGENGKIIYQKTNAGGTRFRETLYDSSDVGTAKRLTLEEARAIVAANDNIDDMVAAIEKIADADVVNTNKKLFYFDGDGMEYLRVTSGNGVYQKIEYVVTNDTHLTVSCEMLFPHEEFVYESNGDGTCVVAGIGGSWTGNDMVIPEMSPDGDRVTGIKPRAFENSMRIYTLVLPDTLETIGDSAFASCESLADVTFPEGLKSIGGSAFYHTALTEINIPQSVESIGDGAFASCGNIESISVDGGNAVYYGSGNCLVVKADNTLILGCKNSVIPYGVAVIGDDAFRDCGGLEKAVIPNTVTKIGDRAFDYCTSLGEVVIPDGVTSIGKDAFFSCKALRSVELPDSVNEIGTYAFLGCMDLAAVILPADLAEIGEGTFYACAALDYITIPESVRTIGFEAFFGCPLGNASYSGSEEKWNEIKIGDGNESLEKVVIQ